MANQTTCLAVIPARLKSTRLPEKPLKDIGGKLLIQRVWEQAKRATTLTEVVLATDDPTIFEAATKFGATALMTSSNHLTGSDRVSEAAEIMKKRGKRFDLIANVQGDMPFINPEVINRTVLALAEGSADYGMSTVATPILSEGEFLRSASVKVVIGTDGAALYFSRAPIPFIREPDGLEISEESPYGFKHMGLYVFRPETLAKLNTLSQSLPEQRERLEQLRALCNGIRIRVAVVPPELLVNQVEVDTPEDLERARDIAAQCASQCASRTAGL